MTPKAPGMQLVGEMLVYGEDWDLDSFGSLFGRLARVTEHKGELTRYVRYESVAGSQVYVRFFGIEVDSIDDIPQGMVAWDIHGDIWTLLQPKNGQNEIIRQESIAWNWLDQPTSGRLTGEFTANCPSEWSRDEVPADLDFHITANAYFAPDKNCDDDVFLVDYDPTWLQQFDEMAHWLKNALGPDVALRIEHYGSTAISGIPAKPVIDILVEVPSFDEARKHAVPRLNNPEWEYWQYSEHMIFIKRKELMGQRTHHIHMAPAEHSIWKGLAFRDYLISHPDEASRYAELKHELANSHRTDRERYTTEKSAFVQEVTAKALLK